MAQTLREALDHLADDSAPGAPRPDLWRRGKRRHRTRQGAAALGVLAVLVAGAGVWSGFDRPTAEAPVANFKESELALPDRVYGASGWTKGAEVVGPIAAAYYDQSRRRTVNGPDSGIIAISAVDGGYRYIDAPGFDSLTSDDWVLSPDGSRIAYWEPNPVGAAEEGVSALRVYDARTGEVVDRPLPEINGWPVVSNQLAWLDGDTLAFAVSELTELSGDGYTGIVQNTQVWDLTTDVVTDTGRPTDWIVDGRLVFVKRKQTWYVDPASGALTRAPEIPVEKASISPSGTRFAGAYNDDGSFGDGDDNELRWGRVSDDPDVRPKAHATGRYDVWRIEGWLDDSRAVVSFGSEDAGVRVVDLDRDTSTSRVAFDESFQGFMPQLAADLVDRPTVPGTRPPEARDLRSLAIGLGVAGVLSVGYGVRWLWRRRRWS